MIGFVKLRIAILHELKAMGFNVLRSPSLVGDPDPNWIPGRENLDIYIKNNKSLHDESSQFGRQSILIIDQALRSLSDEDLVGQVFYIYDEDKD